MTDGTDTPAQTLRLAEVLNLSAAAPLAKALTQMRGADAVVDASQVQRVGAQCVQVLLSAASTWSADGASLRIVNRSADFIACLQLLGIPATTFAE